MKIGVYTPYLDSFGGGERYVLTFAEILSKENTVDLLIDKHLHSLNSEQLKTNLGKHFNLNLSQINLVNAPLGKGGNFIKRIFFLKKYDLLFFLTDGSIFYSTAKKNIIHFQVPFKNVSAINLWGKFKLSSWKLAVCNSIFTKNEITKEWPIECNVVYPPVDIENFKPLKKKKNILSVGRFASFSKTKKHEEMIEAFKQIYKESEMEGWSLHLAGSVEGEEQYLQELKKLAEGAPIFFYPNLSFGELKELYGESSIYWHAAGFGETEPAKMEHFGISTVEAMASGCVPVVINLGGQKEIVEEGISGFLWNFLEELQNKTLQIIKDQKQMLKLSENALLRSRLFSKENFENEIMKLVNSDG